MLAQPTIFCPLSLLMMFTYLIQLTPACPRIHCFRLPLMWLLPSLFWLLSHYLTTHMFLFLALIPSCGCFFSSRRPVWYTVWCLCVKKRILKKHFEKKHFK
uniref:Uncharacterized protein n=1 Tax=Cacopsylla melanoneura TaxID=428564 RepID=A0A8D8SC25_9HEMI